MKKILFAIAACLTLALGFTSCKVETAELTLAVTDYDGYPIADRKIYWTTEASVYASLIAPAPDAPLRDDDIDDLDWLETNAQGIVRETILANLTYVYFVKDEGSSNWQTKTVKAKGGDKLEVTFKVNK